MAPDFYIADQERSDQVLDRSSKKSSRYRMINTCLLNSLVPSGLFDGISTRRAPFSKLHHAYNNQGALHQGQGTQWNNKVKVEKGTGKLCA